MGIIFGGISFYSEDNFVYQIDQIKKVSLFPDYELKEIIYGGFKGGVILNKSLSYDLSEFYLIDETKNILILCSGIVYNSVEILAKLNSKSQEQCLSELILLSYLKWGNSFVSHFNGDFSILIYFRNKHEILLYRDQMGIKPMAYSFNNKSLFFSSDILGLCKALQKNKGKINQRYLYQEFNTSNIWKYSILPNNQVQKVLPGHFLKISKKKFCETKYWYPENNKIDNKLNFSSLINDLEIILKDAVKIRSGKCFTASSHLSGGLDSSIVAALAKKQYSNQDQFYGFSWSPSSLNEKRLTGEELLVKKLSKSLSISPLFQCISDKEYISQISNWRYASYVFHELHTLKQAKERNVNLIFSGWGGDEFISINSQGIDSDLFFNLEWSSFFKKNSILKPKRLLGVLVHNVLIPAFGTSILLKNEETDFFSKYTFQKFKEQKSKNHLLSWRSRKEVHSKLLYNYHIPARIEDWTILGLHFGVEYRYPLIDKRIVEYMFKVPSKLLFKDKMVRIILRTIGEKYIPHEIAWHKQKDEPLLRSSDQETRKNILCDLLGQINTFKKSPYLKFINFQLIEKDYKIFLKSGNKEGIDNLALLMMLIKKRYEFIKGYSNLNN